MSGKRDEAVLDAARVAIDAHRTFGQLLSPEEKQYLLDHGRVRSAGIGEEICTRHQVDSRVYILVMGEVEVREGRGNDELLARLGPGEIFGEIAALYRLPRISRIVVSRQAVLLELPGEIFERVASGRLPLQHALIARYKQRLSETALRSVPLFQHIPPDDLTELIESAALLSFPAGTVMVHESEPGDALYVLIYGTARVSHRIAGETLNVALLQGGDYFGEWSVMTGAPRTATVEAVTRVEALRIECRDFLDFIQAHPHIRDRLDLAAHNRLAEVAARR